MKKSNVTQELVNIFPPWSKVRTDEQSVGQQVLNPFANAMERLERQLHTIRDNQYITTANLDEIDLVYKVELDADFDWDYDNKDPLEVNPLPPTVTGLSSGSWYPVEQAELNDIETFWYESIPNRVTLENTVSGENHELLTLDAEEAPVTGVWEHHLDGGDLWIEAIGGVQYLNFEQDRLYRGKVIISGETRKGTIEEETLVFPWDMKQRTTKEWKVVKQVKAFDIEDEVEIDIRSADFSSGPYLSVWNNRYSKNRNKIDEFWDMGHNDTIPTLDRIEYQSDEWQQLVLGFSSKDIIDRWELLDASNNTVSGVDMTLQPYTNRAWVTTADTLFLYDLAEETVSGVNDLIDDTAGANVQLDYDDTYVLLGEDITFLPWHARPLKEISKYRLWYKQPNGQKYGLLQGTPVSFSSDFWVIIPQGTDLSRTVEDYVNITTTQRGEYLVVCEVEFIDGETQTTSRIFSTRQKTPLAVLDVSSIVPGSIDGIDFDADQKLWVKSGDKYYQIGLHADKMIIDYPNKIIDLKENYEEVTIVTNG
jgi:hypothetical protein